VTMKKLGVQFHSTHEEVFVFLQMTCESLGLNICIVSSNPFSAKSYSSINIKKDSVLEALNQLRPACIYFCKSLFDDDCKSLPEFRKKNNDHISLLVGRQAENSIQESWFGFMGEDVDEFDLAKKIVAPLKKITLTGLIPFIPGDVISSKIDKACRYTDGAKNLYRKGGSLTSMAGAAHFAVPKECLI
jgi:hypothetical protein